MSRPETDLSTLSQQVNDEAEQLISGGRAAELPAEDLRRLISSAIRLYAAANEGAEQDISPIDEGVATTDAVVMACALLKAEDLNPFDLALWFSRSRVAG